MTCGLAAQNSEHKPAEGVASNRVVPGAAVTSRAYDGAIAPSLQFRAYSSVSG